MSLKERDRKELIILQLEKVDKVLGELDVLIRSQLWSLVANRLYYALFHAVSAMFLTDCLEVGTHRGATGKFLLYYVKTGIFPPEEGHLLDLLQRLRDDGDYNCYIDVTQSDIEGHIEPTLALIAKIKNYISNKQR